MTVHSINGDNGGIIQQIRAAVEAAVPCTELDVQSNSPGHFTIRVVSPVFADLSRVKQQQLVYASLKNLMAGNAAPLHAVDRLDCVTP